MKPFVLIPVVCFSSLAAYVSLGVVNDFHPSREFYHLVILGGLCPFKESSAFVGGKISDVPK